MEAFYEKHDMFSVVYTLQYISMVTLCIGQQIKEVGVTAQTRATLSGCKLP